MPSEDETARLLRQQAEDLGNHRITALPLGDRQPGRRGAFQRLRRPIQGAGDARFDLGPRPGGPALGPSVRRAEVDQRWLAVFDDSMVIERPDGIGGGDLHREGINFRPRRRRSLSDVSISQSVRDALITETRNIAARNPVGPSSFRGRGGGPRRFPVPPVQPLGRPRYQSANTQLNSQPRGLVIQPRPARPGIPGNARTGNWSAPGLVHDQGAFFDKMTKNTGLRCPPMVVNQPGTSKNSKPLAKPMASAKDLPLEVISSQTEKPVQPIESSDQPPEPADQLTEQPKPKPTSNFIPPHLRHTLKKQGPESEVEGKQAESNVEQTSQPVILVQASSTAPAPVGDRLDVNPARKQLLLLAEEVRRVPRTSNSSALRSVSQGGSPRIRPQFFPPLGESRNPLTSALKLRGNAPPFPFPIPLGFYISPEFATQFWNLVAKPLWEQLLEDYDDVQQQIIFLTWYYAEKPHEWKEVMKTGPPTRETILRISEEYMDEDQKAILAYRKAQESKFKNVISPKLGSAPQPPSGWWKINATDSIAISEWAGKLQESHRNAMLESLKARIAEERDPVQTKMLYAKMAFLMHEAKGGPGSLGAPGKQLEEPSDEKDGDVSVLVLDTEGSKEDKEKDLSSLIKLMWDHGLNPEGDSLTEEDFPLTKEQQASPEPECLPPPSTSPPAPLSLTTLTPNISTANSPPPSPPRQNRFKGLASTHSRAPSSQNHAPPSHSNTPPSHSTAPPPKGRHKNNRGQNALNDPFKPRGTVTTPAHRDQSDERRQREKQERMKEINEKFASTKTGQTQGADGHQEFTPSLLEFPAHLLNFGPQTVVQLVPEDTIEDLNEMTFEDIEESEHSQVLEDQDSPLLDDQEEPSTDDFMHLENIMEHQPGISEEEIGRIREMNRDSVPALAVNCYWSFGLRFRSPVRPGDYFTVELDCTARMPADFLKQLRDKIGVEDWEAVSSHPGFRAVVAHATRGFFIKMARKWGPQFIHGIAY